MFLKILIIHYWKSILVFIFILYLSFAPPSTFKEVPTFEIPYLDKIIHLVLYIILSFSLILDSSAVNLRRKHLLTSICLICLIFLGGIIEIAQQYYFAPRTAEWFDWFADITGVFLGWFFSIIFKNLINKTRANEIFTKPNEKIRVHGRKPKV